MNEKKQCTLIFNILLTPLVFYLSLSNWLFEEKAGGVVNISSFCWSKLPWHNQFEYTELVVGLFVATSTIFLIPLVLQLIWNRLICNIYNIKDLIYAEAYTLFLGISLVTDILI